MSINGVNRTAGGGYTLPQHVFLPHPALQHLRTGRADHPLFNSGHLRRGEHNGVVMPHQNVHGNIPGQVPVAVVTSHPWYNGR